MKKKMLITLATGKTGYATAVNLLREGYPVRIFVRSKNARALELEKLGAEVFVGAFDQYRDLLDACRGIENVYYCYPYKPGLPADMRLFIDAAKEAEINSVVFMGQRTAEYEDTGSGLTNDIRKAYALLQQSGLRVVYFVPGYFADIPLVTSEYILQLHLFPNPFGNGKNPWISIDDMGRCIAALLKNPEPYIGQKLFPTGPKSIDPKEMVSILSKVVGKKIISLQLPEWLFFKAVIMEGMNFGFDRYAAVQAVFYNRHTRLNRFDMVPTQVVKELTGREPEDFETIARNHFARLPYRHRTWKSWFTAFWKFNKMPFTPVPGKKERLAINNATR